MPKVSQRHKKERRELLISADEQVFLKKGYPRATVQDVLDQASVRRGGLYLYFSNMVEIFEAVLERQDKRFLSELRGILSGNQNIGAALLEMVTPVGPLQDNDRRRVAVVVEYNCDHRDDPERREKILARYDRAVGLLVEAIESGVTRGEFRPTLPIVSVARFLMSAQDGYAVHVGVPGTDRYDPVDHGHTMAFFLRTGLGIESLG